MVGLVIQGKFPYMTGLHIIYIYAYELKPDNHSILKN